MFFLSTWLATRNEQAPERRLRELTSVLERCSLATPSRHHSCSWDRDLVQVSADGQLLSLDGTAVDFTTQAFNLELRHVEAALQRVRDEVKQALARGGLSSEMGEALLTYVDAKVTADLAVREALAEAARVRAERPAAPSEADLGVLKAMDEARRAREARQDDAAMLKAAELAQRLAVSDETVRNREQAGELFSILRLGRKRGREYPAFQARDGVAGAPLKEVLAALGRPRGPVAYAFFTSAQDTLAGLSPLEALVGVTAREVSPEAQEFLQTSASERLATVVQAAQTYASSLET